jgi:hypothetical protein
MVYSSCFFLAAVAAATAPATLTSHMLFRRIQREGLMVKGLLTAGRFVPAAGSFRPRRSLGMLQTAYCLKLILLLPLLHWRTRPCCAGVDVPLPPCPILCACDGNGGAISHQQSLELQPMFQQLAVSPQSHITKPLCQNPVIKAGVATRPYQLWSRERVFAEELGRVTSRGTSTWVPQAVILANPFSGELRHMTGRATTSRIFTLPPSSWPIVAQLAIQTLNSSAT